MSKFLLPYNGEVFLTSKFGQRELNGVPDFHNGVDLVGMESKILYAPCDGKVIQSRIVERKEDDTDDTWEWGNYIAINTDDGYTVYMCHMKERNVEVGDTVKLGDVVGVEGNTGYSFGSHCHFEIRKFNVSLNPDQFLPIENKNAVYKNEIAFKYSKPGIAGDGNTPHSWSKEAVDWIKQAGILEGDSADKLNLRLNDAITREEMCVLLYRLCRNYIF